VPGHEGLTGLLHRLFGRRGTLSPVKPARGSAVPEDVIREHFAAAVAHDLDRILLTQAPERARLYDSPRTTDKRRLTVTEAQVLSVEPTGESLPMPGFVQRYAEIAVYKVEFELRLVPAEDRRDPTVREGRQWSYFVLVSEGAGKPWMLADWGT